MNLASQSHSSPNAQQCASVMVIIVISHVINSSCGWWFSLWKQWQLTSKISWNHSPPPHVFGEALLWPASPAGTGTRSSAVRQALILLWLSPSACSEDAGLSPSAFSSSTVTKKRATHAFKTTDLHKRKRGACVFPHLLLSLRGENNWRSLKR